MEDWETRRAEIDRRQALPPSVRDAEIAARTYEARAVAGPTLDLAGYRLDRLPAQLGDIKELLSLDCSFTQVSDLAPVAALANLQSLNCWNTGVSDLTPLAALPKFGMLVCGGCPIADILAQVLSHNGYGDNCWPRVQSWWAELAAGAAPYRDRKLFLLGNGTVGKTQLLRRLLREPYDKSQPSTHGIEIRDAMFDNPDGEPVPVHVWDFGGQDIYHGTHALFLKSRAIFVICWNPASEAARKDVIDGVPYRNLPLGCWLAFVRERAGPDGVVIVIETQCDEGEASGPAPSADEACRDFAFLRQCHTGARKNLGFDLLRRQIALAIAHLEQGGVPRIGVAGHRVMDALATACATGTRWIRRDEYQALCTAAEVRGWPAHLLDFLHHSGAVFHRDGQFGDRIILDQSWALEAIYAVFHRGGTSDRIRANRGRFTLAMLAELWAGHDVGDHPLLLDMMCQCGMAFRYVEDDEDETIYVAPDLLPPRDTPSVDKWVRPFWQDDLPLETDEIRCPLLPDSLIREIMARIGDDAAYHPVYWRHGLLFFDQETQVLAMIEAAWPDDGWAGTIRVTTQRRNAAPLLDRVIAFVSDTAERLNIRPIDQARLQQRQRQAEQPTERQQLSPGPDPTPGRPAFYVTYAWSDGTAQGDVNEARVEAFCQSAEAIAIEVFRDKTHQCEGVDIDEFMRRIARADRVFAMIGEKYWRSPFCQYELHACWRHSGSDEGEFFSVLRPFAFADARLSHDDFLEWFDTVWSAEEKRLGEIDERYRSYRHRLVLEHVGKWRADMRFIQAALAKRVVLQDFDAYLDVRLAECRAELKQDRG